MGLISDRKKYFWIHVKISMYTLNITRDYSNSVAKNNNFMVGYEVIGQENNRTTFVIAQSIRNFVYILEQSIPRLYG